MEIGIENKGASTGVDAANTQRLPIIVRGVRLFYEILAWAFLLCIIVQVFIAGLASFMDPADWEIHKMFVRIFALTPLVMFLLTFVGRIRGQVRWLCLGLFGMVIFQFLTVQIFTSAFVLAAFHPVIALLLFWGSVTTVKRIPRG
ncbi:DUF6220 domain-containing protein [Paenibacillus andongensis]|uniref:DUF6220 domain-containing protein n=1 Tax=Paenibacillus andongensis TaxID=2975482 RepID=UPI0021BADDDD|nr:DUF6220 domain-containing protein [Paenibacillus andongensis]